LEQLISSHLELDLNVKKNSSEIVNLKNNIKNVSNNNENNIEDFVEIKLKELKEEFMTMLNNKESKAERKEEEHIEAEIKEEERKEAERKEEERKEAERKEEERKEAERIIMEEERKEAERIQAESIIKEAERKANHNKEEEERLLQEEILQAKKREAQRLKKERLAKEEADRLAKEEADRLAKEEADRLAKEEADRLAKEEADRLAKEEANRLAKQKIDKKNLLNMLKEEIKKEPIIYPNSGFTLYFYISNNLDISEKEYNIGVFIDDELRGKSTELSIDEGKVFVSINLNLKNNQEKIENICISDGKDIFILDKIELDSLTIGGNNLDSYPILPILSF
jgi:hypothetical protein